MGLRSAIDPRRFSVRGLSAMAITGIGALMLAVVVALVVTSSVLQKTSSTIVRGTRSVALAEEIELHLLAHERFGNLAIATNEPTARAAEARAHNEALRLLKLGEKYAKDSNEVQLLRRTQQRVNVYLRKRDDLESARPSRVSEVLRESHLQLSSALASLDALAAFHRARVDSAHQRAQRAGIIFKVAAVSAGALVLIALIVIAVGVRRYLLRPVGRLRQAIDDFRESRREPPAPGPAPRELAEIAGAFNEMSGSLIRQREAQLAFLAGVAHDLRNPLSAIKTGVQILEMRADGDTKTTAILNRQIDHLERMLGDLVEASRIEAGQLELHVAEIDLREPAREVTELYRPLETAHQVTVELPDAPVPIRADRLRIEQVIGNLVKNALKYSPEGGPVFVSVSTCEGDAELAVTDRGIGISSDALREIFLPFKRHARGPGAGLGLAVARGIVLAHGGSIDVASEPGTGSTFRVRIPLAQPPEPEQKIAGPEGGAAG